MCCLLSRLVQRAGCGEAGCCILCVVVFMSPFWSVCHFSSSAGFYFCPYFPFLFFCEIFVAIVPPPFPNFFLHQPSASLQLHQHLRRDRNNIIQQNRSYRQTSATAKYPHNNTPTSSRLFYPSNASELVSIRVFPRKTKNKVNKAHLPPRSVPRTDTQTVPLPPALPPSSLLESRPSEEINS